MNPKESPQDRIRKLLTRNGMSQSELAQRIGVTDQAVSKWFKTGYISDRSINKIALVFKVSASWIRYGERVKDTQADYDVSTKNIEKLIPKLTKPQLKMLEVMLKALVDANETGS